MVVRSIIPKTRIADLPYLNHYVSYAIIHPDMGEDKVYRVYLESDACGDDLLVQAERQTPSGCLLMALLYLSKKNKKRLFELGEGVPLKGESAEQRWNQLARRASFVNIEEVAS
jgi:hypothetical protein